MNDSIRRIRLDRLVPHPDSANRMSRANFAKLVRNIERTGRYEPLVVRRHPDKRGHFQIINGSHRCQALRELGHETAQAVVWKVDDEQTDLLLATLNRLGGRDMLDKKLAILRRLCRRRPVHDLAKLVGQTHGQLQRLMSRRLNTAMPQGRRSLYAIPLVFFVNDAQQQIIEEALAPAVAQSSKTTRAAKRAAALARMAAQSANHLERTGS
jgi:hypothetical protein